MITDVDRSALDYVGSREDLADPLGKHNRRESKATRRGVPWMSI
jgi:hypothetical protein